MSKETKITEMPVSKLAIVRKINALLNLGDAGKMDSFFARVIKTLNNESKILSKNLDTKKFKYENDLDELKDQLEDAQQALNDAYNAVTPENVVNNEAQKEYVEIYLDNIDFHEAKVKAIEEKITSVKEAYKKEKESTEKQIDSLAKRIAKISAE